MDTELDEYIDIPAPVLEAPPLYSNENHEFLSGFEDTPHAKRLLEYLLLLGLTLEELSQGLRHPRFLHHCGLILGPAFISAFDGAEDRIHPKGNRLNPGPHR